MAMDLDQTRKVFQAAVLTALADGKPDLTEMKVLGDLIAVHPAFSTISDAQSLLVETWSQLRSDGMEACLRRIADGLLDRDQRELAFSLCARVMTADGSTAGEEAMVLGELQELFGFSPEDVKRLLSAR
jgi:tellurite resistance protein